MGRSYANLAFSLRPNRKLSYLYRPIENIEVARVVSGYRNRGSVSGQDGSINDNDLGE